MASKWCRINLAEGERAVVDAERDGHPDAHVRRKMPFVWSCHCGADRATAAKVAGVSRATAERYVAAYRDGGLGGLRQWAAMEGQGSGERPGPATPRRSGPT